jgi:hypothetical protein
MSLIKFPPKIKYITHSLDADIFLGGDLPFIEMIPRCSEKLVCRGDAPLEQTGQTATNTGLGK